MTTPANLRPDAFAGAAVAYARYRPPYPKPLLDDLLARAAAPPGGMLLDLACGPGRVALDLAGAFESVWAVDLEPEMVEVGRHAAARRGVGNISWFVGRAEDLAAPPGSFDLITIGEAFHRLDQTLVARKAFDWLKPDGCLATMGGGEGFLAGGEPWRRTLAEVVRRWMARAFPGGWGVAAEGVDTGPGGQQRVLRAAGFIDVTDRSFDEPRDWTIDEIIGYLQSMSVCSRKALEGDFDAFEAELRAALGDPDPATAFHETMTWGYTLARKPPSGLTRDLR
jgi:SAM-dependent methyltransferase